MYALRCDSISTVYLITMLLLIGIGISLWLRAIERLLNGHIMHRNTYSYYNAYPLVPSSDSHLPQDSSAYNSSSSTSQCLIPDYASLSYSGDIPELIHRVPCLWGGSCPILLDDISAAGIMRHLRDFHLNDPRRPWDKKARGRCEWGNDCHKEMAYASYGKHVAAVHLRGRVQCPYCHKDVGRTGLLDRHIQNYCRHAA